MFDYFLRLNTDKQQNGIKNEILIAVIQEDTTLKISKRILAKTATHFKQKIESTNADIFKNCI